MNHELDYSKPIYNGRLAHATCGKIVRLGEADDSKVVTCVNCQQKKFEGK